MGPKQNWENHNTSIPHLVTTHNSISIFHDTARALKVFTVMDEFSRALEFFMVTADGHSVKWP
jgi:hypothetical protein